MMPEPPPGFAWRVKLDGERVTVELINAVHSYVRARQRAIWCYRGTLTSENVAGEAQKILDRMDKAKELERELGLEVEWS